MSLFRYTVKLHPGKLVRLVLTRTWEHFGNDPQSLHPRVDTGSINLE